MTATSFWLRRRSSKTSVWSRIWSKSSTSQVITGWCSPCSHPTAVERGTPNSATTSVWPVALARSRRRWSYVCWRRFRDVRIAR